MKLAIYLAGPITGLDEAEAFEAFALAERFITDKGHEPLNPMKLVDQAGDRAYEEYLLDALEIVLTSAQALYMLDGWRSSLGARIEHAIAVEKKLPIFYQGSEIWD